MFYIFIAFFAIASGFTSADELCSQTIREVCPVDEEKYPQHFPTTEEDLKENCDYVIKLLDCGIPYEERCHSIPEMLPAAYDIYALLHEVCNPDSLLHGVVVENLECFYDGLSNEGNTCRMEELSLETLETQARELAKEGFEGLGDDDEDEDSYRCLRDLNAIACQALVTETKCGTIAKDAFVEIVQRLFTSTLDVCSEQSIKMLPSVIRLKELENVIEEALKRRRK